MDQSKRNPMTLVRCEGCDHNGKLGNSVRFHKVYKERGKRMSIPLCDRYFENIETRRRPEVING